jgi:hypothetical protein
LQYRRERQLELIGHPQRDDKFRGRRNGVGVRLGLRIGAAGEDQA